MHDHDFTASTHGRGGTWRVSPVGELDLVTWPVLHAALADRPARLDTLVLEMDGVSYMDVTGLNMIEHVRELARRQHATARFTGWRRQPWRLLQLAERTFPEEGFIEDSTLRLGEAA